MRSREARATLSHWKAANGFPPTVRGIRRGQCDLLQQWRPQVWSRHALSRDELPATDAIACYVSNFGNVGTDDAVAALTAAEQYENSGQVTPQPGATVAMEYDPVKGVQFWAYHGEVVTAGVSDGGKYFPNPALDSQGPKTMPDICMACHQGTYSGSTTTGVAGAVFLPFDLDSFKDDTDQLFPVHPPSAALQTQMHTLNNMIANTSPPAAVGQLVNLWYSSSNPTVPFAFNRGAAQLPSTPFSGHEPLYDNVIKEVCRTCHVAINPFPWNQYTQLSGIPTTVQNFACAPKKNMPNAEVPWINYWQQNKNSTLASELNLGGAGCPNN